MKYSAKQIKDGRWAVHAGTDYFLGTEVKTKEEAEILALIKSAQYHQSQMDKIHQKLINLGYIRQNQYDEKGYLA